MAKRMSEYFRQPVQVSHTSQATEKRKIKIDIVPHSSMGC